jgi:heat shock protein HslJ
MKYLLILIPSVLIFMSCSAVNNVHGRGPAGTWVMHEMTGVELNKELLTKGLPFFEFNVADSRFSGHAGCNQLSSQITVSGEEITFGIIIRTEMACPHMEVENAVINILNENTLHYEEADSGLILTSSNGIEMRFSRDKSD